MHFQFAYFYFVLIDLELKDDSRFIRSRTSLENHTQFQTKIGKVYTRFQAKKAQTPYPLGAAHTHIPTAHIYPEG